MSVNYFDSLIYQVRLNMSYQAWLEDIKHKFNPPECLPVMPMCPHKIDALRELHKQYPSDAFIAKELIKELENKL